MNCAEIQARLADDVLGEMSAADHDALASHVAACPLCASERAAFEEAVAMLRDLDWPVVEPVLLAPQRERVAAQAALPPTPPRATRRRAIVLSLGSLAAAALVAAIAIPSLLRARISVPAEAIPDVRHQTRQDRYDPPAVTRPAVGPPSAPRPAAGPPSNEQAARLNALGYDAGVAADTAGDGMASGFEGGVPGGVVGGIVGGAPAPPSALHYGGSLQARMEPARDMYFRHQGTNPFVSTERDALSTFGLDVDTASYAVTRNYLMRGALPPPEAVRVEEFVNALPQDYAAPRHETFAVHLEGAPSPFQAGEHLLRVGLKAREVRARERKPAHLTFVIDVSGSMAMENRLELVKRSLRLLVDRLGERDRIGIVVYGTRGRVVLEPTPASDRRTIVGAIKSLQPEGSTNLEEGLDLGYRLALEVADPEATNRVVLCTDGVANNGITNPDALVARIHAQSRKRVFLTALGFGMGNFNDVLLQRLADQGDGQYAYIDDDREAERFFLRNLSGVLETVARDAKAQVEFDPSVVASYRLVGYEKRDVADEDFRNDDVDGGEVGAGHTVTALYELKLRGESEGRLGSVSVRFIDPDTGQASEQRREIEGSDLGSTFEAASAGFRRTVIAARFAEHLRGSRWVGGERFQDLIAAAERLPGGTLRQPETAELLDLMQRAATVADARPRHRIR